MTVPQAIRLLYGHSVGSQLLEASVSPEKERDLNANEENAEGAMEVDLPSSATFWSAELHFSNANYQAKKMIFLLFINRKRHFMP